MSWRPGVGGRSTTSGTGSLRRMAGISIQGAARTLLDSDAVAHVVTLNEDGSPHVTAAWVGVEGDEIVLATIPDQRKLRNLPRPSHRPVDPDNACEQLGLARVPDCVRDGAGDRGRCPRDAPMARPHIPRTRRCVSTHAKPAARVCHEDHAGAVRRRRALEPHAALTDASPSPKQEHLATEGVACPGLSPAGIEGTQLGLVTRSIRSQNASRRCRADRCPIPRQAGLRRLR
jgi:Pyridoxamine 5'-phosphate oxidase